MLKLNNNIKGGIKTAFKLGKSMALSEVGEKKGLGFSDVYGIILTYKGLILQFFENRWKWTQFLFMGINIILYIFSAFSPIILATTINLIRFLMNALRNDKVAMIMDAITIFIPISNLIFILPFSVVRFVKQSIKFIIDHDVNLAEIGLLRPLYNKGDENGLLLFRKENPGDFDEQTEEWNELSEFEQDKYVKRAKELSKTKIKTKDKSKNNKTNKDKTNKDKTNKDKTNKDKENTTNKDKENTTNKNDDNINNSQKQEGGKLNNEYFIHYLKYKKKYLNIKNNKYLNY